MATKWEIKGSEYSASASSVQGDCIPSAGTDVDLYYPKKEDRSEFLVDGVLQRADSPSVP